MLCMSATLFATSSKVCKTCHPSIYSEYYESAHRKASIYNDPIHKALWEAQAQTRYSCAPCHTPSDPEALLKGYVSLNRIQKEEPISCIYCHTITDITESEPYNITHHSGKKRDFFSYEPGKSGKRSYKIVSSWFGLVKKSQASPFHKIDYSNKNYQSGKVCMGCHGHTDNKNHLDIIMLDAFIDAKDPYTCISCHMPQVTGSKVTLHESKTHAYHALAGINHKSQSLGKYIDFKIKPTQSGFDITLVNHANHALFGAVYRQGILNIQIQRDKKSIKLKPYIFERILGKKGIQTLPYNAHQVIKDSLIYAKRTLHFAQQIQKGDRLIITLSVQNISKSGLKALKLSKRITPSIKLLKRDVILF